MPPAQLLRLLPNSRLQVHKADAEQAKQTRTKGNEMKEKPSQAKKTKTKTEMEIERRTWDERCTTISAELGGECQEERPQSSAHLILTCSRKVA